MEPVAPTVRCPTCGGPSRFAPDNPSRPFCTQRCKQLDLGAWASDTFRLPASAPTDEPDLPSRDGSTAPSNT